MTVTLLYQQVLYICCSTRDIVYCEKLCHCSLHISLWSSSPHHIFLPLTVMQLICHVQITFLTWFQHCYKIGCTDTRVNSSSSPASFVLSVRWPWKHLEWHLTAIQPWAFFTGSNSNTHRLWPNLSAHLPVLIINLSTNSSLSLQYIL